MTKMIRWGVQWRYAATQRPGRPPGIMWSEQNPLLFVTRREARRWITEKYGYIRHRKDLRSAPHYWRMPQAVRVSVEIKIVEATP